MKTLTQEQLNKLLIKFDSSRSSVPEYHPMDLVQSMMHQYGLSVMTPYEGCQTRDFEYEKLQIFSGDTNIMIHNINHFRIATPERRLLSEFGLGASPRTRKPLASAVSTKESLHEEDIVLAYDLVLSYHNHYQIGSITVHTDQNFTNGLQNLYAMGLMTAEGLPLDGVRPEGFELIPKDQ